MNDGKEEDEIDANIFQKLFGKKIKTVDDDSSNHETARISKDSDIYDMNNFKRGNAIIFNHYAFSNPKYQKREGTDKDVAALDEVLNSLCFDVCVCDDFTYGEIYDKLNEVAKSDHSAYDCLVVVVLSHGEEGKIYAKDYAYPPDTLWSPFMGDKCATLAGKPKMFFIQACRGEKIDSGILSRSLLSKDSSSEKYSIPVMADLLVMYSTYAGYYSWRNLESGSWFIQTLCEELKHKAREKDILAILTTVNRRLALEFESYVPDNPDIDSKKQIGSVVSTFTRLLYFYPREEM